MVLKYSTYFAQLLFCLFLGLVLTDHVQAQARFSESLHISKVIAGAGPGEIVLQGVSPYGSAAVVVKPSTLLDLTAQRQIEQLLTNDIESVALYGVGTALANPAEQQAILPPGVWFAGLAVVDAKKIVSTEAIAGTIARRQRKNMVVKLPRVKGGVIKGWLRQKVKIVKGANRKKCKRGAIIVARGSRKNANKFNASSLSCSRLRKRRIKGEDIPVVGQLPIDLNVVDATKASTVLPLVDGAIVNLSDTGSRITIQADFNSTIRSALFQLSGAKTHVMAVNSAPYTLNGGNRGDLDYFIFSPGTYTLHVKGMSGKDGSGHVMASQRIRFEVVTGREKEEQEIEIAQFDQFLPEVVAGKTEIFAGEFKTQEGCDVRGGFGTAVLVLNRAEKIAGLQLSYQGLTDLIAHHVHADNDAVLLSLDDDVERFGSTYVWRIMDTGEFSVAGILRQLARGQLYVNLHSSACPKGELKAVFTQVDTPDLIIPSGDAEIARFLNQATFGATPEQIAEVNAMGAEAFLNTQLNVAPQNRCYLTPRVANRRASGDYIDSQDIVTSAWWDCALNSPQDEICHRTAFALSQQWVVSGQRPGTSEAEPLAHYYDILKKHCFGNLRDVMEEITLSAPMGVYLDMLNNSVAGPNENFAREIMQLFTIGKDLLRIDGTPEIDPETRLPIPTYEQEHVVDLSRVFTGFTWGNTEFGAPAGSWFLPMRAVERVHDKSARSIFRGGAVGKDGTALSSLRDALDQLFYHPSFCPFNARRLIQQFVTSNPSPEYIARVASACEDNGFKVRGDLRRMVYVTLLDQEARDIEAARDAKFGKLRQPTIVLAHMMKLLRQPGATPAGCFIRDWHQIFAQTPMHAPSVFNFFEPDYANPGLVSAAKMVSPEFQTLNQTTLIARLNYLWGAIDQGAFKCAKDADIYDVPFDLAKYQELSSDELASLFDLVFTGGSFERDRNLLTLINTIASGEAGIPQVQLGLKAVISSSKHMIQK